METIERVAEMIVTIEEFSDLLDQETAAIRAADTDTIEKLSDRKDFLALHYQRQLRMLADRRLDLKEMDRGIKTTLCSAWRDLDRKVAENVMALEVAQKATRHVVDLIVNAIRENRALRPERGCGSAYSGRGVSATASTAGVVSVSVNRVL